MTENGSEAPTALEKQIIRQIEYYFGDANLKRDRFLQEQVKEDEGWVPLEIMIKFNRLKAMTEDYNIITTALEKSTNNLIEVNEDRDKIRRYQSKPLPQDTTEYRKALKERSIYCKGFPLDEELGKIQDFLDRFGETEHIYMRRDIEKKFKGSVFATYADVEMAKKFMKEDGLKYGENEVVKMFKEEYFLKKVEERKQKREEDKQKKLEEKDRKEKEAIEATKADFGEYDKGCIVHFSGADDQTSREDLKEFFADYGTVSWIDFTRGQTKGHIRFDKETPAAGVLEKALAANENKITVRGCDLETCVLEGDEEAEHWNTIHENMSMVRIKKQQGRKGKSGRGRNQRGGRGGYGGGSRDRVQYQGTKKVFKEDSDGEDEGVAEDMAVTKEETTGRKRSLEDDEQKTEETPAKQIKTTEAEAPAPQTS
ncbi:lupus La protein homolog [Asterias rubens]|uniref:lupus La protein homolog n=1 Tax=Asterias rubens TaxID=7604 RepID=UPI001455041B|nr:lupus La protein homolog [Asterias rubens]XP_033629109.1 lupus La protein homolog [Asterias rubens]XP_033629110.1 lupus La protein homolog [Asterias rubens]